MRPTESTFRHAALFIALLAGALAGSGCSPSFQLVWRSRYTKPTPRTYLIKHFRAQVTEWPSTSSPRIAIKVERMRFTIETAKKIRQQFKKFEDGKYEKVPEKSSETKVGRITGDTTWEAAPGVQVVFEVDADGNSRSATTDDQGMASFDVSGYAEEWIEGGDIRVVVKADLSTMTDPQLFEKLKGKSPSVLNKALKFQPMPFYQSVTVRGRTLRSIFERR